MLPYILLIVLPIILWMVSKKYRVTAGGRVLTETQSASIDVFMLILMLLLGLRGLDCGNDTRQYWHLFQEYGAQSIVDLILVDKGELGFRMLCKVIGTLSNSYQILLCVTALFCIYPVWFFYKRESEQQLLTIALFLTVAPFMMYFSGIRQAMAMAMGIPCWYAVKQKKVFRFVLLVLLSMQFHTSAFVLFVMYPIYYAQITPKWLWFVVPCIVAVFAFRAPIFNFLLRFLWQEYETTPETGAITVLLLLIVFAVFAYFISDEQKMERDAIAMRNMLLLSVVIQIFAMLHPLSMRMNYYFLIFVPILIPKVIARCKVKYGNLARLSGVLLTVFFFGYFLKDMITDNDGLNIFPYIPFWNNV